MPGGLRQRSVLAPAGHAAVDQLRIACEAVLRSDAQTLGDAGPIGFEQRIGFLAQAQHGLHRCGLLEV